MHRCMLCLETRHEGQTSTELSNLGMLAYEKNVLLVLGMQGFYIQGAHTTPHASKSIVDSSLAIWP